jgi:hypothetical protein
VRQFVTAAVVLVIAFACVGLFMSWSVKVKDAAHRAKCQRNLKWLALATQDYVNTHEDRFPPAALSNPDLPVEKRLGWLIVIAPHMEQDALYRRVDKAASWDSPKNLRTLSLNYLYSVQCYLNETRGPYDTDYLGIAGLGRDAAYLPLEDPRAGLLGYNRQVKLADVRDGLETTMLVAETCFDNAFWAAGGRATVRDVDPDGVPYFARNGQFRCAHRTCATLVGFADGSVKPIAENIDPRVFEAFATIAAGD